MSLLTTIEQDLSIAENWLVKEAEAVGTALWDLAKAIFVDLTAGEAKIILDLVKKLESDALASKSLVDIETDLLNLASIEEQALLATVGSKAMQGIIGLFAAQQAGV